MSDGFVVVVEGCDKVGKTTLCQQLSAIMQVPIMKFGQPGPQGAVAEYNYALDHTAGPFIADRFHLGESVYGPIYRETPPMNQFEVRAIENKLMARGCLLILMEDAPERIIARFKQHDEEFAREEDVRRICHEFALLFRSSRLPKIRADLHPQFPVLVANLTWHMRWAERPRGEKEQTS